MASKVAGENVLYPELSYKIMEIVFEVHNKLGPGFTEGIYEEATATIWNCGASLLNDRRRSK